MIRFIAATSKEDWIIRKRDCICLDDKPPNTPYMKIEIKILKKCKLFDHERDQPIKNTFRRFIRFIKSKLEVLS